ncbi:MAG TPA: hypothetical protein VKQ36_15700, partial [Ktedonobacterales bacterium]|nr:hypothetical protein [Ktedonobacterales bacterium]
GVLLGAVPLAHHHVMLTTLLLLGVYVGYLLARLGFVHLASAWLARAQRADLLLRTGGWLTLVARTSQHALGRLALMGGIALATVAYYVIPIGLRAGQLGQTDVLNYPDHFTGDIFSKNGAALWLLATLGLALICLAWLISVFPFLQLAHTMQPILTPLRTLMGRGNLARDFALLANLTLLPTFYLAYFGYRAYSLARYHQPAALFTPTRFLTDMTYFLAIYAAVGLAALWLGARWVGRLCAQTIMRSVGSPQKEAKHNGERGKTPSSRERKGVGELGLPLTLALRATLLAFCLVTLLHTLTLGQIPYPGGADQATNSNSGVPAPGVLAVYAWVRDHTPPNTLVVNLGPDNQWAAYFTRREVYLSPIPTSEFIAGYIVEKRLILGALLHASRHVPSDRLFFSLNDGTALPALLGRPLAVVTQYMLPGVAAHYLAYRAGVDSVYLLPNLYTLTLAGAPPANFALLRWNAERTRFTLTLPALSHAWLVCQAQVGATVILTLDGRSITNLCSGLAMDISALGAPGLHVIVGQLGQLREDGSSRWFDLMIFQRE